MKQLLDKVFWVASIFILSLLISSLNADDTEIFFGGAQGGDAEVQPNILMILDTSGSMGSNDDTSPPVSRIDRVKASMYDILNTVDNVNIGLMRFNNPGGPILYPLVDIDGDACDVENCAATSPIVSSRIRNDNEDAEELSDGSVILFDDNLKIVDNPGSGAVTTTVSFSVTNYSDDIEERLRDGRVQPNGGADYEMMDDSWSYDKDDEQLIGARFRNIDIPANATITSAKIVLTIKDESMVDSRENDSVFIDVVGEKAADTTTFQTINYNLSSRPKTTATIDWDIIANSPSKYGTIETPDLMPVVNEIVAQGWVPGNAMTFYFQSDPYATNTNIDGDPSSDGNGMRRVYTRNSSSSRQPRLELTYVIGTALADSSQTIGLHFNDVLVPQGATITDAFLDFTVQTTTSGAANFNIVAEKSLNSATFDSSNFSLSSRIDTPAEKTLASVSWTKSDPVLVSDNLDDWDEAGIIEQSPDIKAIIQELVNQSDWCGGNAISLFITGSGQRNAVSHDLSAGDAPNLRISYDPDSIPTGGGNEGCINTIINKPVTASRDDAEEEGDGSMVRYSTDLDFRSYTSSRTKHSGVRFVDMKIPKDAAILEARLELHLLDDDEPGSVTMTIKAQNEGDTSEFGSGNSNISDRPTVGSVSWTIPDSEDGEVLVSPDISSLIQSVVSRADWVANNALTIILTYASGSGHKEFTTYNSDPINAPRLIVKTRWEGSDGGPLITNRSKMVQVIDDLSASGYTPIVSVLDEARRYFEGLPVLHGSYRGLDPAYTSGSSTQNANSSHGTKYRVSHPASYVPGTLNRDAGCTDLSISSSNCKSESITSGVYKSPMHENYPTDDAKSCQRNFIILLTDGQANAKSPTSISDISSLTGNNYSVGSCSTSSPSDSTGKKCGPELTKYMYENDLDNTIANKQNVVTYTIGFAFSSDWIKKVATDGGGSFFEASGDSSQLTGIFESILREIISVDTTFVSPGATVNQFNRLFHRNEVYFSLFKPEEHAQWDGNLKKYLLEIVDPYDANNPDHPTNGVVQIVGQHSNHTTDPTTDNAQAAVDTTTGFFDEDAQSYWSSINDGSEVSKGGVAEQIPNSRPNGAANDSNLHIYTDIGGANGLDLVKIHEDNAATITKALLDIELESDANHINLLRWTRGVDVNSGTDNIRDWMGDPLHSHPGLVTYGGTNEEPILRLFVGSNDGFFHIIDASNDTTVTIPPGMGTGKEIFAFMPQELLKNQNIYFQNTLGQHPYGVDGAISFWVNDIDKNNIIDGSDHVFSYFGLRRGGKSYYALDVSGCSTNPCATEPSIKWKINNTDGNGTLYSTSLGVQVDTFKELAQSWSKMELAKVKINSVIRKILIFGGGYDVNNDTNTTRVDNSEGRAIYIVDADTGERLWVAGSVDSADFSSGLSYTSADMKYSIPANIRVLDTTGDGFINQFYVGDMGGQIWRFDINNSASSFTESITGGVIADLGADASVDNNRRFFYSIDATLINIDKTDALALAIGSGWRSHPLDVVVDDHFFVLKTKDVYSPPKDENGNIIYTKKLITDLLDVTEPENVPDGLRDDGATDPEYNVELALKEKMDFTGFYITMETDGEKIISESTTFNNKILFSSFLPVSAANICQAAQGSGRLYIIDLYNGKAVLDLNDNDTLEPKTDRYTQLAHGGIPPSPSILIPEGSSPPILLVGTESPLDKKKLEALAPKKGVSSSYWREAGEYWDSGVDDTDNANLRDQ